ncbi:MAG TPA: putative sulfate exporter family transporter [Amycolatopsis sp.]|nr:putative sulfate exporter family transporter [Amycolatopsis sp.]
MADAVARHRAAGERADLAARGQKLVELGPGLLVALVVAVVATLLGRLVPIVGGPVFGILVGALAAAVIPGLRGQVWQPGFAVASKLVLQLSIVVLGTGLSLTEVVHVGGGSLPVMLGTLAVALLGAWLIGRLLRLDGDTRTLIGVGTGICGASAIAATTAVIDAAEADIAYSVGTIFTFNIAAVLLFPPIGHLLGMGSHAFGLWSGTAINDTSSVVAASFAYGGDAGSYAIVVKLTRTLMIIPIVIVLAVLRAKKRAGGEFRLAAMPWRRIVPLFLVGFLVAATLDSVGLIPTSWHGTLSVVGTFLITTALAGIGLSLRFSTMRRAGVRPLLLGAILWVAVAATSLGLQAVTGTL